MHKNESTQNSHSILALTFFLGICLSRHQRIWNQHIILRFFDTHVDSFNKKKFLCHNSTFCNLKVQMRKNWTFSNILQKVKSYLFAIIYHSPFDSIKFETLKPPTIHTQLPSLSQYMPDSPLFPTYSAWTLDTGQLPPITRYMAKSTQLHTGKWNMS